MLGRLKMYQYLLLGLLFVPCYALNEWLLLAGVLATVSDLIVGFALKLTGRRQEPCLDSEELAVE